MFINDDAAKRAGYEDAEQLINIARMDYMLLDNPYSRHLAGTILWLLDSEPPREEEKMNWNLSD